MSAPDSKNQILRIIDVNLNRLREALRIIEEYFRFFSLNEKAAISLKQFRHSLEDIEKDFGADILIACRDTSTDPFASATRPEEKTRTNIAEIVRANFKRSQEASRVIEEYAKVSNNQISSEKAKTLRFSLYNLEKELTEHIPHE